MARRIGVVGGLGPLASADVFFKLVQALPAVDAAQQDELVFTQQPFRAASSGAGSSRDAGHPAAGRATTERKLYVFETLRDFEARGVTTAMLPCFLSHTFLDELRDNTPLRIVDMLEAVRHDVRRRFPHARRIGVLATGDVRRAGLFERYFDSCDGCEIVHPRTVDHLGQVGRVDAVTEALYGEDGMKQGNLRGRPVALLRAACDDLIAQGVDVIVPGVTEIALVAAQLGALAVPLVDSNLAYAQYVAHGEYDAPRAPHFKVGVLGGVGPAATVDFLDKLVRNTPAARDQDHIRLVVEQNPQIPDRTGHLTGDGADPTISLYATCKQLEADRADLIAIPCNTAHVFVERIQPYLRIPIVNMLTVTARHIRETWPAVREVGMLATSGTLASGVYAQTFDAHGLRQIAPSPAMQTRVMNAIYGPRGVKAGFTEGECMDDIEAAARELVAQGVRVIVLGCTELPLLLRQTSFTVRDDGSLDGTREAHLVDPTSVLARACVSYAMQANGA